MATNDYDDEFDETADPVDDEPEGDADGAADAAAEPVEGEEGGKSKEKDSDIIAVAETLTVSSKEAERRQLEEEMERFLAAGGKIRQIPAEESNDPPKRPRSSYGSKPI